MRPLFAALLFLAACSFAPADEPSLKEARQRWLEGNYEEARTQFQALAKDAKQKTAAVIGLSRAWQAEGEYDKALEPIDAALADSPKSADLHARRAELLYLRGRWQEALDAAEKAIGLQKEHFLGRWVRAQVWRDRGEHKQADAECRWFVRTYTDRSNNDKDIKDPDELLLVGLAGAENARWHNLSDQFRVILRDVYGDALKNEKDFWPAECEAGLLLLEKYNRGEALDAFDKALKINPNAAEALVGKGLAALQTYEIREAERFAERALKINGKLPEALRLRADLHLVAGNVPAAMKELETARKVNPRDEHTLGRVAACLLLQKKQTEFEALVEEVVKHDPKPGIFYWELAERLEERNRFDEAQGFFEKAIDLRPMVPWPRNSLGLLLMRLGREKEARAILNKAAEADPFNVRVGNTLKVLRHLEKYETLRTEHFELRFDRQTDGPLARYLAGELEVIYADLALQFQYRPKGPILFEVFNNHEMFSGRVVNLPDLHTIGACTGRMFAMVSPHGKGINKPFNWARVVRHEMVHIFNLEQTGFQVPHWLTEGLAVNQEGFPRPQSWNLLLQERVASGELLNLDNINMGFIRPQSPAEWHLAYCQSQLYVNFLKSKYGSQIVGGLLQAYADGLDTAAAIKLVCKVDKAEVEKGYLAYLQETVKTIKGKPVEKAMTLAQLRTAQEKDPDNPDLAARLADEYLTRNRKAEARKLVEGVLAKKKDHPVACYVKARLLLDAGDLEEAQKLLESALDRKSPETKVLQALGKLYYESREMEKAVEVFELARKSQPYDSRWLTELARTYAQLGNKDKQIDVLKELAPTDADDLEVRKRLARMLLEAGRHQEAEKYARQALEIDILDPDAQEMAIKALVGQKKDAEAEKLRKLLEK